MNLTYFHQKFYSHNNFFLIELKKANTIQQIIQQRYYNKINNNTVYDKKFMKSN